MPSTQSQQLEALVLAAASGDTHAQNELLTRYGRLIAHIVRARRVAKGAELGQWEEDDDLIQTVALDVLTSLPKHEWRGRSAFMGWMRRLADAALIDRWRYHRAKMRDRRAETATEGAPLATRRAHSVESELDEAARLRQLEAWIDELEPRYAAAVRMSAMGYSHGEIGEALGCSAEAARKLVARGEAKLVVRRES